MHGEWYQGKAGKAYLAQLPNELAQTGLEACLEAYAAVGPFWLSGKADIAFEHLLEEPRLLAGSPKRRGMHDPITKWAAVTAFTARDRSRECRR